MDNYQNYIKWEQNIPQTIKNEKTWSFWGYRKALYLYDLAWNDCDILSKDYRGRILSHQLIRSVSSISANIEEGQGRGYYGKERQQYLRYAIGSARETKGWYFRCRTLFNPIINSDRFKLLDEIIGYLVKELSYQKSKIKH